MSGQAGHFNRLRIRGEGRLGQPVPLAAGRAHRGYDQRQFAVGPGEGFARHRHRHAHRLVESQIGGRKQVERLADASIADVARSVLQRVVFDGHGHARRDQRSGHFHLDSNAIAFVGDRDEWGRRRQRRCGGRKASRLQAA